MHALCQLKLKKATQWLPFVLLAYSEIFFKLVKPDSKILSTVAFAAASS